MCTIDSFYSDNDVMTNRVFERVWAPCLVKVDKAVCRDIQNRVMLEIWDSITNTAGTVGTVKDLLWDAAIISTLGGAHG